MKQFKLLREFCGKEIAALVIQVPGGIHISLYGGDLPHIGAVGIVDPTGGFSITQFPDHREGILCKQYCAALSKAGFCPAVVEAGIHYDKLDRDGISCVLSLTDEILNEILRNLSEESNATYGTHF